jgi:hypothetical protein
MIYRENDIPADQPAWRVREAGRLREWLRDGTDETDGILRWKSNGRVVPASAYRDAYCTPPAGSAEVERQEGEAFLEAYRRLPHEHDAETLDEMRREFGAGSTVVNVVTGRRISL